MKRDVIHQLVIAMAILVLIAVVCVPAVAHETSPDKSDDHCRERGEAGGIGRCNDDGSQYTIDEAITGATPHWAILTLGAEDKKYLLDFIDSMSITDLEKTEWKGTLESIWKKYPVNIQQGKKSLRIALGPGIHKIDLTPYEESILGEIDDEIGRAMEESLNSEITVTWAGQTHVDIFASACKPRSGTLLQTYCDIPINSRMAEAPDSWCGGDQICQTLNHGYIPGIIPDLGIGLAPANLQKYATEAYNKINSGEYQNGYENLAYASHFLADVGNPMHTGSVVSQGIPAILNQSIHKAYEDYVVNNWDTTLPVSDRSFSAYVGQTTDALWGSDPFHSGVSLAVDSSKSKDVLIRDIYRNFIQNRGSFKLTTDPEITAITVKNLIETKQYTNGLVRYAANGARIFVITSDTGSHGTIYPPGAVSVLYKTQPTFTITPNGGYVNNDVTVDRQSVGAVSSYSFPPVDRDHRIRATFERGFFTITPSAGSNGQISPSSPVTVPRGGSQIFTITSNPGYRIRDMTVDGNSIGPIASYTFTNVQDDHRIRATFRQTQSTFTITPLAGPHGTITPSTAVTVPYAGSQTFTITPDSGYGIDQVLADGVPQGPVPSYTFTGVTSDHTISATFKSTAPPPSTSTEWIWSRDGWGDWQHIASWSVGDEVGPNSEYGPVMVNGHGEHGTNTNLLAGSTQASVWRTFSDPSDTGWNTLTFNGLLSGSDVPQGRWMKIEINGQQIFAATAQNKPPGNNELFEIKVPFPQTATATVKISHGQNPAWGPIFYMEYDSLRLSLETDSQMTALTAPSGILEGNVIVANMTENETPTTGQ